MRMGEAEKKLEAEVQKLLAEAARIDAEEDAQHGKGRGSDELPKELKCREERLRKIREAAEVGREPPGAAPKLPVVPMAQAIVENVGKLAETTSADAGYFSAEAVEHPALQGTNLLVPPSRQKHGAEPEPGSPDPTASAAQRMRHKLASAPAQALYKMRKAIVEPVFGQIKEVRGLRRLLLRGFAAARAELRFIALTHNLLELFRSRSPTALLAA